LKLECHNHVVQLISSASKHNVAVVPVGGGTNVTGALECSAEEKRMIVSLDTSQMVTFLFHSFFLNIHIDYNDSF